MYISLSWRNIWRNKKRTIIVASSVFFAVMLAAVMRSAQLGSYSYMIDSSAKLFTGYLQIQGEDYWEKRSLDESIVIDKTTFEKLTEIPHVTHLTPRLEAFALISHETTTKVSQVIGIEPILEDIFTEVKEKLIKGTYLNNDSRGLLMGSGLASMLKSDIGDSIVIYGQGFHGQIAAAIVPISGIVKLPFKAMDNAMIFLPLPLAQEIFSCEDRITSLPILIDNVHRLEEVEESVNQLLTEGQKSMLWNEMLPDLEQSIEVDNVSGIIMLAILYIVIAFGVFGTVMMMVSERAKEFAILISVGMRRRRLLLVLAIETFMVSFVGVVIGILGSMPIIFYLVHNPINLSGEMAELYDQLSIEPILNFSAQPSIFISQALVVLIIAIVTIIYPLLFVRRLDPAKTMRG
ncbi:MAG: ABC transporter permease [Calditrichia bacterium]|nr:ABC transporter permease [Calditrichia bacterium]